MVFLLFFSIFCGFLKNFILSFNKYLLSSYCFPSPILSARDAKANKNSQNALCRTEPPSHPSPSASAHFSLKGGPGFWSLVFLDALPSVPCSPALLCLLEILTNGRDTVGASQQRYIPL